ELHMSRRIAMRSAMLGIVFSSIALVALSHLAASDSTPANGALALVKEGAPVCKLVIVATSKPSDLLDHSAKIVADTVERWSDIKLSSSSVDGSKSKLPDDAANVFVTYDALKQIAPNLAYSKEFSKA